MRRRSSNSRATSPGFDRLAETDVVGNQEVDPRKSQGLAQRQQLVGFRRATAPATDRGRRRSPSASGSPSHRPPRPRGCPGHRNRRQSARRGRLVKRTRNLVTTSLYDFRRARQPGRKPISGDEETSGAEPDRVTCAQSQRQIEKGNHGGISATPFEAADVIVGWIRQLPEGWAPSF